MLRTGGLWISGLSCSRRRPTADGEERITARQQTKIAGASASSMSVECTWTVIPCAHDMAAMRKPTLVPRYSAIPLAVGRPLPIKNFRASPDLRPQYLRHTTRASNKFPRNFETAAIWIGEPTHATGDGEFGPIRTQDRS